MTKNSFKDGWYPLTVSVAIVIATVATFWLASYFGLTLIRPSPPSLPIYNVNLSFINPGVGLSVTANNSQINIINIIHCDKIERFRLPKGTYDFYINLDYWATFVVDMDSNIFYAEVMPIEN